MTYRAGIVGLGNIGLLFDLDERTRRRYPYPTHASAYKDHPRIQLVAACDPDDSRREMLRQHYEVDSLYADVEGMLRNQALDILSVCVPAEEQGEVVHSAIRHGTRLIFCEKPFATSPALAEDLLEEARRGGSSLVVNYWRRFDPSHGEVRRLIQEKKIGSIQEVRGVYGNGLQNIGSHMVDLLLWYVGPVRWVIGLGGVNDRPEDPGLDLMIGFNNGVRATLVAHSYQDYRIFELDILGSNGRVSISNEGLDIRWYSVEENEDVSGARQLTRNPAEIQSTVGKALYHGMDYITQILDQSKRVLPEHAVQTHRVIEAARWSAASDGKKMFL